MITKFYALCIALTAMTLTASAQMKKAGFISPGQKAHLTPSSKDPLPPSVSREWFEQAALALQKIEDDFHPGDVPLHYEVLNKDNGIQSLVRPDGYSVSAGKDDQAGTWKVDFSLAGFGRRDQLQSFPKNYLVHQRPQSLVYEGDAITVEYFNDSKGLRQNFIINDRPAGIGNEVAVTLNITSSLQRKITNNNELAFSLGGPKNTAQLIYGDLKVWDAQHKALPAKMELDANGHTLSLVVNDKDAVYPLTVDPLNHTFDWITSADGVLPALLNSLQLQAASLYGYRVTALGDVSGDGLPDVAISAPAMADVITGSGSLTGVGAVFVYFGATGGLSPTPSKILQPTTAVTGALFGYSVAGGDLTGDGVNEIIVGAPLDRASVDFGGGNIVNATVGKVYVYQGASLAGSNPTPLLSLSLTSPLLSTATVTVNALFGFSVAVADDMNGDSKGEIVVGAPTFARLNGATSVKTGGAFVFLSNNSNTFSVVRSLEPPTGSLLGLGSTVRSLVEALPLGTVLWGVVGPLINPLLNGQLDGLLFGFSVDGAGDYNNDGIKDVIVGAPAGVSLGALTSGVSLAQVVTDLLTGQILGGSAYVFAGDGAQLTGVSTSPVARLQAQPTGLLSNAANLFGYSVKGSKAPDGSRNGHLMVGAPLAAVISNLGGLQVNAGQLHIFKKQGGAISSPVVADQVLSSPRATSILSILSGQTLQLSVMYGASVDNTLDMNCDGSGDLVVGEPLSTSASILSTNVVGGAAYIYYGKGDGTYTPTPAWTLTSNLSPLLGVNATSMVGFSVAGIGAVQGGIKNRVMVGGPTNSLDFGSGLLNLGNTMSTVNSFAFDNNGLGKAYTFDASTCLITLPVQLTQFTGAPIDKTVKLNWETESEASINMYQLERSLNATDFSNIALVFAKNDVRTNDYDYIDKHPSFGTNYYRLKIIENDGSFKYSNTIAVSFSQKLPGDIIVAPNPVQTVVKVRMIGLSAGTYRLELQNSTGQLVQSKTVNVAQYEQDETMDRSASIAAGIYWLNIYDKTQQRIKTVRVFMSDQTR